MNQTPELKPNIGPALTPQVLPSPTNPQLSQNGSPAPGVTTIKPELTIEPTPAPEAIAPSSGIYPPLEVNHPISMPAIVPATIPSLPDSEAPQIISSNDSNAALQVNQEVQDKPMTLEDHINLIRNNLYVSQLTPEIEDLITKYVDAYHTTLDYCLRTPAPEEEKVKELELLSGPINEIYNPNNPRLFDGNNYPAVELILNKVDEYAQGLEKGFTRIRMPANASASQSTEQQPVLNTFGYLSVLFIFIASVVFSIALGYLLFILKK